MPTYNWYALLEGNRIHNTTYFYIMFTNSTRILSYAMLAASLCFVSCDDAYDLSKDINSDIQIGQQFRVPVGHTDTIYVNRIIEESETLTTESTRLLQTEAPTLKFHLSMM